MLIENQKKTIYSVQALRGLSALFIMFYHFRWSLNTVNFNLGEVLFWWMSISVDLFFIISGFVIAITTKNMESNIYNVKSYYNKRMKRIFPAYYSLLSITFFLNYHLSGLIDNITLKDYVSAVFFMPIDSGNPPFYLDDDGLYGIRWTLNYEIYFYVIIGLFIFMKNDWKLIVAYFFMTVSILPFFLGHNFSLSKKGIDSSVPYLNLVTNPIIYVFLLGYVLGIHYERALKLSKTIRIVILLMSCFIFYWGVFKLHMIKFDLSSSGWLLGVLFYGIVINEDWIKVLIPSWLLYIGECSLSLYLIHTLFNHVFRWILDGTFINNEFISFGLGCAMSIFFAMLSFRFIEKPFYYKKKITGS